MNEVLNVDYQTIFTALLYEKDSADYEKRLRKNMMK